MRLLIDGGDGDQDYFGQSLLLESVERDWFTPNTPRGLAKLFLIVDGRHKGEYVAITSRVASGFDYQLSNMHSASVIVSIVKNIGKQFSATLDNLDAVGMAFAEVVDCE